MIRSVVPRRRAPVRILPAGGTMATKVEDLLFQHSSNGAYNPQSHTQSKKNWAEKFHTIKRLNIHTLQQSNCTQAVLDGPLLREYSDDQLRKNEPAYPPNSRIWRLESEADGKHWFLSEISNIVLASFADTPLS
jgi:hypothetical protein